MSLKTIEPVCRIPLRANPTILYHLALARCKTALLLFKASLCEIAVHDVTPATCCPRRLCASCLGSSARVWGTRDAGQACAGSNHAAQPGTGDHGPRPFSIQWHQPGPSGGCSWQAVHALWQPPLKMSRRWALAAY